MALGLASAEISADQPADSSLDCHGESVHRTRWNYPTMTWTGDRILWAVPPAPGGSRTEPEGQTAAVSRELDRWGAACWRGPSAECRISAVPRLVAPAALR